MDGMADGRFDLEGVVPRWQIVTFLFRANRLVGGSVGEEELVVRPDAKSPVGSGFAPVLASKSATVKCSVSVSVVGMDSIGPFQVVRSFPIITSFGWFTASFYSWP